MRSGDIKALYLAGDVPPLPELAQASSSWSCRAIAHSDLVKHAQVVLPATTFAEMDGTMTNLEGRVQRLRQVVEPVGQARPGWWIVARPGASALGAELGATSSAADVLAEIAARRCRPMRRCRPVAGDGVCAVLSRRGRLRRGLCASASRGRCSATTRSIPSR